MHWRVGRRLGSCILISVQLIGSIISAFSMSSVLENTELIELIFYILSGRIGKAASHAEGCKVARSNPGCG